LNIKISKYYNKKQAENYETSRNNPTWHAESKIFNEIKNRIKSKHNKYMDILDVGVGTGRWIPDLYNVASKYVGTDISKNMLDQARLKLEQCPNEFQKNVNLINSSIEQLPLHVTGRFDLIIMTRFLSHFSIAEIKNILKIIHKYSKSDLVVSFRVADKKLSILSEIVDLIIKSPIGAIKRFRKSGRLSYARLDTDYENIILECGFSIVRKNLVVNDKYNRYEYWELTAQEK
jgi:ubiquinone/menaquinone biosynthesis C-methylase UbiE